MTFLSIQTSIEISNVAMSKEFFALICEMLEGDIAFKTQSFSDAKCTKAQSLKMSNLHIKQLPCLHIRIW